MAMRSGLLSVRWLTRHPMRQPSRGFSEAHVAYRERFRRRLNYTFFSAILSTILLSHSGPASSRNFVDARCGTGVSCQIYGCNMQAKGPGQREFSNPPHCRSGQGGFGEAQNECARIGGTWRPGPGGAPFIWCDFNSTGGQSSSQTDSAQTQEVGPVQQTPRGPSRAERMAALAAIAELGLELTRRYQQSAEDHQRELRLAEEFLERQRNPKAEEARVNAIRQDALAGLSDQLRLDRDKTAQQSLGDLSDARKLCGNPGTRMEISQCFRTMSAYFVRQAAMCEDGAQSMSTPLSDRLHGAFPNAGTTGAKATFDACTDIRAKGAKVAHCVAVGILREDTQFNPLYKQCMQKEGLL
jgi:hypothetical protein